MPHMPARRNRRFRAAVVASLLAVTTAACRGPVAPIGVVGKDVPLDLVLGTAEAVAVAPVPPVALDFGPDGVPVFRPRGSSGPVGPPSTRPPAPAGPCPELDPLNRPKREAPNSSSGGPPAGVYTYRTSGRFKMGGANPTDMPLPATATVEVKNATVTDTFESTWQVAVTLEGVTTTTTYRVTTLTGAEADPPPYDDGGAYSIAEESVDGEAGADVVPTYPAEGVVDDIAQPARGLPPGLYISRVESTNGDIPFTPPGPGILLTKYPMELGRVIDAAASDGTTSMSYRTTIRPKARVNACGTPIDTFTIELTRGRISRGEAAEVVDFTAVYRIATQFGGLIVSSDASFTGSQEVATPIERTVRMITNTEPKPY